jgi:hypothetical protein
LRFLKGFYIRLKKFYLVSFKFSNFFFLYDCLHLYIYKNSNFYKLVFHSSYKYNWVLSYENINYFYINLDNNFVNYEFIQFFKQNESPTYQVDDIIDNVIDFKNKTGFLKKSNNLNNHYIYKKLDFFFNDVKVKNSSFLSNKFIFSQSFLIQDFLKNKNYKDPYNFYSLKNLELKNKYKNIIKINRIFLNSFFKRNFLREFKFNKFFKKISKFNLLNFLYIFNFSLNSILIQSRFFENQKDIDFFLKNGFILINDRIVKHNNEILKEYDIIKISYNQYYYLYHRIFLHSVFNNFLKLNNKIFYFNKFIKMKKKIPNWIFNIIYFKEGVPSFLEVDYLSMSIVIVFNSLNFFNLDFFIFKFLNVYLNRLYNWRYII